MTHPHDFALLNDLLDERLAPAAADEMRRRVAEEPELAGAYEDLRRLRRGLRALPSPAVPPDFLAKVHERARLAASGDETAPAAARKARLLPFRRISFAIAATIGVAIGATIFFATRIEHARDAMTLREAAGTTKTRVAADSPAPSSALATTEPEQPWPAGKPNPRLAPGGSVAPGLRPPENEPAPAAVGARGRTGSPRGGPKPSGGGGGGSSGAVPPESAWPQGPPAGVPLPAPGPDAAKPPSASPVGGTPLLREPADPAPPVPSAADAESSGASPQAVPLDAKDAAPSPERPDVSAGLFSKRLGGAPPAADWARAGVDEVLTVYARSFDEARAEVALLVSAARSGDRLEEAAYRRAARFAWEKQELVAAEEKEKNEKAKSDGPVDEARKEADRRRADSGREAAPILGSFVVEVPDAAWARLASAASERRVGDLDDAVRPESIACAPARDKSAPADGGSGSGHAAPAARSGGDAERNGDGADAKAPADAGKKQGEKSEGSREGLPAPTDGPRPAGSAAVPLAPPPTVAPPTATMDGGGLAAPQTPATPAPVAKVSPPPAEPSASPPAPRDDGATDPAASEGARTGKARAPRERRVRIVVVGP